MQADDYRKYEPFFGSWYFADNAKLGSGNFGSVFRVVRHDANVKPSALKIITIPKEDSEIATRRSEGMDDAGIQRYYQNMVDDMKREYELMSELKGCSSIVSCEDFMAFRHEDGFGFDIMIRMELLTPLITYEAGNEMNEMGVMELGIDMCHALERCEQKNIIHRDIKPDNIFISDMGDFKLGDFGIARTMEADNLQLSSRRGTPNYMAPEVYFSRTYDRTADIYSLGIVLYRMLNDRLLPFLAAGYEKKDAELAFLKRMKGVVLPRPAHGDEALKSIVLKACAYNSRERYQSPGEMRKDLELVYSIIRDGGRIPENFAVDLDATVSTSNTDITADMEAWLMQNVSAGSNEEPAVKKKNNLWKVAILGCAALALGAGIWAGKNLLSAKEPAIVSTGESLDEDAEKEQEKNTENAGEVENEKKPDETESADSPDSAEEAVSEEELEKERRLAVTKLKGSELETMEELADYKNLESLDLAEMEITSLPELSPLENLKELNISYTNITDIGPLKKCGSLLSLDISYNNENMTDRAVVDTLASMTQLEALNATGDLIVGEHEEKLGALTNLTSLYLGAAGISDGGFLRKCKHLKILDLQSNLMLDSFQDIAALENLEELNISVTGITKLDGIEKLKKLEKLDISMTDISDVSMLKSLKNLKQAVLPGNPGIKKQMDSLKKTLKQCKFEMI